MIQRHVLASILSLGLAWPLAVLAQQAPPTAPPAAGQEPEAADSADPDAVDGARATIPLDEIRRLVMVYNAVREGYVEPVEDRRLMQSAVRGLLLDLDPHSAYLSKADAEEFEESARGAYDGVGVELQTLPDGTLRVIAPLDDGPAARAGLRSGDVIVAIDGRMLTPQDVDSSQPLRGAAGSKVVVRIQREGTPKPFDVSLVRETIRLASVRSRLLEPGFGYVRISSFQAATAADFARALDGLGKDGPLRGLLIDLRSNPGGLLLGAVQIADELLDKGRIVSTRGRVALGDTQYDATAGDRLKGAPVVVLIDAGSASASEVLAGALRDNGRARVVGSRSFGKGSVQSLLPLDNGDSVKLTTARYYTPSGKSIQALGIVPDVPIKPDGKAQTQAEVMREAVLPGHLRGEDEPLLEGSLAGDVLDGEAPIAAAFAELKRMAGVLTTVRPAAAAPAKD